MVPESAFGGGAGNASEGLNQGLSTVHNEAARIAQEEVDKADQIAITDARGQLMNATTDLLFGQNGVLTRQGKDAFTAPEDARAHYSAALDQIRAELGNDRQRQAFSVVSGNQWAAIDEQVQSHVAKQRQVYSLNATDAAIANAKNLALNAYDNPTLAEPAIQTVRDESAKYAALNGWSPEQTKEITDKHVSDARFGVLERFVNSQRAGDDVVASQYLAQHKSDFVGKDILQAERLTDGASVLGDAQRRAHDITATAASFTDAISQVETIQSPRVQQETERIVRQHYADAATDDRQRRAKAFADASSKVEQTGDFGAVPLSTRMLLTPEENTALERRAMRVRNPEVATKPSTFSHLANLAGISDATRQEFVRTDLVGMRARGELSEEDFRHFTNLQSSIERSDAKAAAKGGGFTETSVQKKEEALLFKQMDARRKAIAARAGMDPSITQYLPAPPAAPDLTPWMLRRAAIDPDYNTLLRMHGAKIPPAIRPSASGSGGAARVPGGPIDHPGDIDLRKP